MTKFWELFERSIIIQGVITLSLIGTMIYMYIVGRDIPPNLVEFTALILGFWFGSKVENTRNLSTLRKASGSEGE